MEFLDKKLIGVDQITINQKLDLWDDAINQFNTISEEWKVHFKEALKPEILQQMLNNRVLLFFIQRYFIDSDPELSKLAASRRIKIEKLIEITDFPDFSSLKNSITFLQKWATQKQFSDELERNIEKVFSGKEYFIPEEIKTAIIEDSTYFTTDEFENKALEKVQNLCDALNQFNDLGIGVSDRDLPHWLQYYVRTETGDKTYGELKSGMSQSHYFVPRLVPDYYMFKREENSLLQQIKKHLP